MRKSMYRAPGAETFSSSTTSGSVRPAARWSASETSSRAVRPSGCVGSRSSRGSASGTTTSATFPRRSASFASARGSACGASPSAAPRVPITAACPAPSATATVSLLAPWFRKASPRAIDISSGNPNTQKVADGSRVKERSRIRNSCHRGASQCRALTNASTGVS